MGIKVDGFKLPGMPKLSLPGLPGGKNLPLSSKAPDVDLPSSRPPSSRPSSDINPPPSKTTPDMPEDPVIKPPDGDPPKDLNPPPSKSTTGGNLKNSLLFGGVLTGGTLLGGEINNLFQAGAAVGQTAIAGEAAKEIVKTLTDAVGSGFDKLTENPINLAIVAGVIALVVLR